MKVSIAQINIAYGNASKNYERTANALQKALDDHPDVIVLPEMWNTGYALDQLDELADENGERTRDFLSAFAKNMTSISSEALVPSNAKANFGTPLMILTEKGS